MSQNNSNTEAEGVCLLLPIGKTVGEDVRCAICFTPIVDVESISLRCSHSFCESCILNWHDFCLDQEKHPTCPLCRMNFHFVIVEMHEWIRDDANSTMECSSCQRTITYGGKPAYCTPDKCDHQFCYQCMTETTRDVLPSAFKCPVCHEEFACVRLYR